jgi:hypothetical protein
MLSTGMGELDSKQKKIVCQTNPSPRLKKKTKLLGIVISFCRGQVVWESIFERLVGFLLIFNLGGGISSVVQSMDIQECLVPFMLCT